MIIDGRTRERHPLITGAGAEMLERLREHPDAPRFNHATGDRLREEDLPLLESYRAAIANERGIPTLAGAGGGVDDGAPICARAAPPRPSAATRAQRQRKSGASRRWGALRERQGRFKASPPPAIRAGTAGA